MNWQAFMPTNPIEAIILAAAALSLLLALLSLNRMMRAAGFIVLSVGIALVAMWLKDTGQTTYLIAAVVAGGLAMGFMSGSRPPGPNDDRGLRTSGR